ncbi:MAG: hypothetical protein COW01_13515 [Bdellovibrionales bacterium CG12_big_fil_rev_8_21_14_0_65_38_15]|nr:MAG: hypothetical protein COW79_16335 [Bdellovibrionales bacterium CG22_combo_CG10-13_8_21_14_all_38_13]PIQ53291.1 MAG: hypothetical protein COW01_13515 [Bdellovibrionales bacterium CG12_big_fil_rev_8_21_14_0_65_38_15]PIR30347.1 MAG: hypothetical protein COV38_06245 [Bdellovibrionales bacterium CG11_big_fil_rev_8_21_14_0_20_38_13]
MYNIQLVNITSFAFIPLALHYLKVVIEDDSDLSDQCMVNIFEPVDPDNIEQIATDLFKKNPELIGFSMYVWSSHKGIALARELKRLKPEVKIVVGGPDVTPVAREFMCQHQDCIDFLVLGEGEFTFKELVSVLSKGDLNDHRLSQILGLCFFSVDGFFVENQRRHIIENLDEIPSPYLTNSIDLKKEKRTVLLETYRGCPFICSYCYYPKDFGKLIHSFSLERIDNELEEIFKHDNASILLMDPTFNVPPERAKKILRLIAKYNQSSETIIYTELRVDLLDEEIIHLLKKAKFKLVEIGLQSSDRDVLKGVARTQNIERIVKNAKTVRSLGIKILTQVIAGLPGDTPEKFLKSIDFALTVDSYKIDVYQLQLLPGTPLLSKASELGLVFDDRPPRLIKATREMTEKEIDRCMRLSSLISYFYNNKVLHFLYIAACKKLDINFSELLDQHLSWIEKHGWEEFLSILKQLNLKREGFHLGRLEGWLNDSRKFVYDFFVHLFSDLDNKESVIKELIKLNFYLSLDFSSSILKMKKLFPNKDGFHINMVVKNQIDYDLASLIGFSFVKTDVNEIIFFPDLENNFLTSFNGYFKKVLVYSSVKKDSFLSNQNFVDVSLVNTIKEQSLFRDHFIIV